MRSTVPSFSCYVYINNGVATHTMWHGSHFYYGINFAPRAEPMIILYAVAVLMAVLLFA